jgi:Cu/Ag efflux pump CusA
MTTLVVMMGLFPAAVSNDIGSQTQKRWPSESSLAAP